jgi:hypothetical protein
MCVDAILQKMAPDPGANLRLHRAALLQDVATDYSAQSASPLRGRPVGAFGRAARRRWMAVRPRVRKGEAHAPTTLHGSSVWAAAKAWTPKRRGRARAPDSPVPGEGEVSRMRRTTGHGRATLRRAPLQGRSGWTAIEAGLRSEADGLDRN